VADPSHPAPGAGADESPPVARPLREYDRKRDFGTTPEPSGDIVDPAPGGGQERRFVIQQHDATRLHWDLRLEHDGVLLSWALPRGLPWDPRRNHLAVHTEDHPLQYLTFEGHIPDGNYGAGRMTVWDEGTYVAEKLTDSKLTVVFDGRRAQGRYALFQTDGRNWMIHRMDPPADPERRHPPERYQLIQPGPGPAPRGRAQGWAIESFWPGLRCVLVSSGGVVDLLAQGRDPVTPYFPEVRTVGRALGFTELALDGVVTAAGGRPRLERRLGAGSDSTRRRLARDEPVSFVAVDLLWQDGHPTTAKPWHERRRLLEDLALEGPAWTTPSAITEDVPAVLAAAARTGVGRLVAKRTDAPYEPRADPAAWRIVTPAERGAKGTGRG
jgi:bifunctional non-homologous end joining protein LigD